MFLPVASTACMARCDRSPSLTTSYRLCPRQHHSACILWMFEASNILLNAAVKAACEPVNSKERRTACCMSKFSLTHFAVRLSTDSDTLELQIFSVKLMAVMVFFFLRLAMWL